MRAHARYPTTMPCWLELSDGRRVDGWLEDISVGGAGVRVNQDLSGTSQFTLIFTAGEGPLRLACDVRHTRDLWRTRFIHARFRRLSPEQQASIDEMVARLAQEEKAAESHSAPALRKLWAWLPRRG